MHQKHNDVTTPARTGRTSKNHTVALYGTTCDLVQLIQIKQLKHHIQVNYLVCSLYNSSNSYKANNPYTPHTHIIQLIQFNTIHQTKTPAHPRVHVSYRKKECFSLCRGMKPMALETA